MIVVDTSALVAIFQDEPDAIRCATAIAAARNPLLPPSAFLECSMVLTARAGPKGSAWLDAFIAEKDLTIPPFTERHARIASEAFLRYGKGRHPAALNFGDCMSYAVAKVAGRALLFAGGDFALTDVGVA